MNKVIYIKVGLIENIAKTNDHKVLSAQIEEKIIKGISFLMYCKIDVDILPHSFVATEFFSSDAEHFWQRSELTASSQKLLGFV